MKIAHLILAYNEPGQLKRLVEKLRDKDADFYIHIDLKADIAAFARFANTERVQLIEDRVKITWGSYSIVQATLNGFEAIIKSGKHYDYINLLSGHDYPLATAANIHTFLLHNKGRIFMEYYDVHSKWTEAIPRIEKYHLTNYQMPGKHTLERLVNAVLPRRKMPNQLIPVGRSQWFTIPLEAVKYIVSYLQNNVHVANFFRLSWAPDEMIFQTILYNSTFRGAMINDNLRYIDWSEGNASPKTFTIKDMDVLQASGKLFARKFNTTTDEGILDELDKYSTCNNKIAGTV